jgi:hypothetical protein
MTCIVFNVQLLVFEDKFIAGGAEFMMFENKFIVGGYKIFVV